MATFQNSARRFLSYFLVLLMTLGSFLVIPQPRAYAQDLIANINSEIALAEADARRELDALVNKSRIQAQREAELDAEKRFDKWLDKFRNRLRTSGFLDWYFSYFANKSSDDQELLCKASHSFPIFHRSRTDCDIFSDKAKTKLINDVLRPLESDVDDINNHALGVFFETLSQNLKTDLNELKGQYEYRNLTAQTWERIETDLCKAVPGLRGEALFAPPPIYLSLIRGDSLKENELLFTTELGEVAFSIPSLFLSKKSATRSIPTDQAKKTRKLMLREVSTEHIMLEPNVANRSLLLEKSEGVVARVSGQTAIVETQPTSFLLVSERTLEVAEIEQLGFSAAELTLAAKEGEMIGMSLIKLEALADPLLWIPVLLMEGKYYNDLNSSKALGVENLSMDLSNALKRNIKEIIESNDYGLRGILNRVNVGKIAYVVRNNAD